MSAIAREAHSRSTALTSRRVISITALIDLRGAPNQYRRTAALHAVSFFCQLGSLKPLVTTLFLGAP
ncbi:MAG: hypothetical protein ACREA0_03855 [bacterium]